MSRRTRATGPPRPDAAGLVDGDVAGAANFRLLVENIPHLVWQADGGGNWIWASPQWAAFTGQRGPASRGLGWLDVVHPDDRARTLTAWQTAVGAGHLTVEHRLQRVPCGDGRDGSYLWFETRAMPLRDAAGRPAGWFGTSTDVDALYRLRDAQARLLYELQRRSRNNLALVRGLVRRIAATATTADDVIAHVDDRLAALARIQAAVTRGPDAGVALEVLIREELSANTVPEPASLDGPPVRLPVEMAEKLGLALHELVLGAILDGALRGGRLSVTWAIEPADTLVLSWWERGPAQGRGGTGTGLQREMLERMLAYELKAKTVIWESPGERRVVISLPLPDCH
ncbi:hypothetical protein OPKNFCMD_5359 [Methylobacterium crusticola]|uniref:Blue-light-activated histidine kinase n=1 Tax=Methylobacterium crusticola TaxID=1697972 RepID=A0ABQ4R4S3_9HYPH|nr:PAS domain-containing protein [Methylobacterium crusticola]GJD52593.1 hypothetical protein OPKNFCMD_5359 [Methylobacterium crusticola]